MAEYFSQATTARGRTRTLEGSPARCSNAFSSGRWIFGRERGGSAPSSDVFHQPPIEFGTAVAEEAEGRAVPFGLGKIECRNQDPGLVRSELGEDVAALVADEAVTIETLPALGAGAIGSDDRDHIGHRMADHRPAPQT